jgi:hypothetical protein
MNRLVHSNAAHLRALQISEKKFFAFVEGGLDRSFYDRLLDNLFDKSDFGYQVIAAKELPAATGGKPSLLNYFKLLRKNGKLFGEAFGKKFVCAFFADKDIDDLSRKKMRSPHFIYTSTYDLEGHLLSCGDLTRAVADASGVTKEQAQGFLGPQTSYLNGFAKNWIDWTTLCVISQLHKVNCGCTYDRISAINPNVINKTDAAALGAFQDSLRVRMNVSELDFSKIFKKYKNLIERAIENGEPLKYFKGKWFIAGLQSHASAHLRVPDAGINSLGEKVITALLGQVAIDIENCRCSSKFSISLRELEQKIA